jgi:hypothetical protein
VQAAIRRVWVIENMAKIGPGGFYHLAYAHTQIDPAMLREMKRSSHYGKIGIFLLGDDDTALHVADGEVIAVHWFPEFVRIHFMLETVRNLDTAPRITWSSAYMLVR